MRGSERLALAVVRHARALGGVRALVANARIQAYTASRAAATSALSGRVVDSKSPSAFAEAETPRAARRTRLNASEKFSFVFVSRVVSAFTEAASLSASVASRALATSAGTTSNDQPLCSRASRVFASKSNIDAADAPLVRGRKGEFKKELAALRQKGFTRARIDGKRDDVQEKTQVGESEF